MRSTPTRSTAAYVVAVATALGVTACSAPSGNNARPGPASTATATGAAGTGSGAAGTASARPSDGGSYTTSADVISALTSAGHPCTPLSGENITSVKAPGLQSVTACSIPNSSSTSSGTNVTATVFDNHTDAQAYAITLTSAQASGLLIGSTSERAVLGRNWVVLVPDDTAYARQVSASLGGTVLGGSSSAAG
jgi:hypothetical protein